MARSCRQRLLHGNRGVHQFRTGNKLTIGVIRTKSPPSLSLCHTEMRPSNKRRRTSCPWLRPVWSDLLAYWAPQDASRNFSQNWKRLSCGLAVNFKGPAWLYGIVWHSMSWNQQTVRSVPFKCRHFVPRTELKTQIPTVGNTRSPTCNWTVGVGTVGSRRLRQWALCCGHTFMGPGPRKDAGGHPVKKLAW